jgi:hypothetical protein
MGTLTLQLDAAREHEAGEEAASPRAWHRPTVRLLALERTFAASGPSADGGGAFSIGAGCCTIGGH